MKVFDGRFYVPLFMVLTMAAPSAALHAQEDKKAGPAAKQGGPAGGMPGNMGPGPMT